MIHLHIFLGYGLQVLEFNCSKLMYNYFGSAIIFNILEFLYQSSQTGELPKSLENTQNRAYNSFNKDQEEMLKGTILVRKS